MAKQKENYVDGFVLVVAKNKLDAYKKMAKEGKEAWLRHGALDYKECMGDDLKNNQGGNSLFPKMVKAKPNETVWFSFITYKSKAHRDQVNKKVIKEMEKKYSEKEMSGKDMPFDMKRMAYGGFKVIVQ